MRLGEFGGGMELSELPKAAAADYAPEPFFFRETGGAEGDRWVAWTGTPELLSQLFDRLAEALPEEGDVVFQVRKWAPGGGDTWERFQGPCLVSDLREAVRDFDDIAFRDGGSALIIAFGEPVVIDDHGILFIYSDNEGFAPFFRRFGLAERQEALLYQHAHIHSELSDAPERRASFVQRLGLS